MRNGSMFTIALQLKSYDCRYSDSLSITKVCTVPILNPGDNSVEPHLKRLSWVGLAHYMNLNECFAKWSKYLETRLQF